MSIRTILERLGGVSATARGLGHRNVSTVQGWYERDVIPARQQRNVLELGQRLGVAIDPNEIIPTLEND